MSEWTVRRRRAVDESNGGQGGNRTPDTAIFNRMLYQLSYLASGETYEYIAEVFRGATGVLRPPSTNHAQARPTIAPTTTSVGQCTPM